MKQVIELTRCPHCQSVDVRLVNKDSRSYRCNTCLGLFDKPDPRATHGTDDRLAKPL
jgi:DNA-directed RNA polymerase subunit RPC12/RpoP